MNIVDMVAAFGGVEVNLSIALAQVLLPDVFGRDNPLDDNIKFSDAGFIIRRELLEAMDLSLHGVYGKFSLVDIPDWTPFAKYAGREGLEGFLGKIRIPTPTLRLCLQDFFRSTGIKVRRTSRPQISFTMYQLTTIDVLPH